MRKFVTMLLFACALLSACACTGTTPVVKTGRALVLDRGSEQNHLSVYVPYLHGDAEVNADTALYGDCSVLVSPDGYVMVIDSGHVDTSDQVVAFLEELGIKTIDIYVTSHLHQDHVGGFPAIAEHFTVKKIYEPYMNYTTPSTTAYYAAITQKAIPVTKLQKGDTFAFGSAITVIVLWPTDELRSYQFGSGETALMNNRSLSLKFQYGSSVLLSCGDLYGDDGEASVISLWGANNLQADAVKMNHHGRYKSNTAAWVAATNPKVAYAIGDLAVLSGIKKNYTDNGTQVVSAKADGYYRIQLDSAHNVSVVTENQE